MTTRLGLGPVFAYEWLTTSRRWQGYAGRVLFVAVLLLGLSSVWVARTSGPTLPPIQAMVRIGEGFYDTIVFTQLTLVLLAAPAATAGVICQDKASGTLAQLLATDLSDTEIVLGKLAARLVPVVGLVCCTLPVLALATLLGGIDPPAVTGVFLITTSVAVFGSTLALTFSIWGSRAYEVLLATYAFFAVWLLSVPVAGVLGMLWAYPPLPEWAFSTHPYELALAHYNRPGQTGLIDAILFSVTLSIIAGGLAIFAIGQMRATIVKQADCPLARRRPPGIAGTWSAWLWAPIGRAHSLDGNPVLWYETRRRRPSPWIRNLVRGYFAVAVAFSLLAIDDIVRPGTRNPGLLPAYVTSFQVAMGLPLLLTLATTALVEERARGTLDVLLATPISSRSIVLAKWWSVFRELPRLLVLPALVATVWACVTEHEFAVLRLLLFVLSAAAFWTSIGLAVSTWVSKLGRAIALAVVLYALANLGWPIFVRTLFQNDWPLAVGLASLSVFHTTFDLTYGIERPMYFMNSTWIAGWIVAQAVIAMVLLLATLATFDRSLGRIRG